MVRASHMLEVNCRFFAEFFDLANSANQASTCRWSAFRSDIASEGVFLRALAIIPLLYWVARCKETEPPRRRYPSARIATGRGNLPWVVWALLDCPFRRRAERILSAPVGQLRVLRL